MASISLITKLNSLSEKLKTSWKQRGHVVWNWKRELSIYFCAGDNGAAVKSDHLLADAEGLVVEVLDELAGHEVGVVRVAVCVLLLQKVDFHGHVADALFGPVELVVCHCDVGKKTLLRQDNRQP